MPTPCQLIAPIASLHGTPAEELLDSVMDVRATILRLSHSVEEASPNGRDYYPQGPDAYRVAAADYSAICTALTHVADELYWVADPGYRADTPKKSTSPIEIPSQPGVLPTLHSNGSSARELTRAAKEVFRAAEAAVESFGKIVPNGRDYVFPEDLSAARSQHAGRVATVRQVGEYFLKIAIHCNPTREPMPAAPTQTAPTQPRGYNQPLTVQEQVAVSTAYQKMRAEVDEQVAAEISAKNAQLRAVGPTGKAADGLTLAEHAEAWLRENGRQVPKRDTALWNVCYAEWVGITIPCDPTREPMPPAPVAAPARPAGLAR